MTARDRLGVGLAAVGRPAYLTGGRAAELGEDRSVEAMRRRSAQVLDAAYAAGVRYVDAARSYGRAEEFLAAWLHDRPGVGDVTVASKWGYRYVGDWRREAEVHEVKDHSLDAFHAQLAETRALLGDVLSIYQIHSVTPESPALHDQELLGALAGLRDSGVRVGLSTSGVGQPETIRAALGVRVGGEPLFTVAQSTWNVLEPSAGPALAEAADAGVAVVVKECLANGRLTDDAPDEPTLRSARALAHEAGLGLDQLAMALALAQPWAGRVLTGAVTPAQVARSVVAADREAASDLPPLDELGEVAEPAPAYWQRRSGRAWS